MRTSRCTSWVSKRQRNQRPNCQHSMDHGESKGVPKKQSTSASWVMLKPLCDHNKLWKILKEMGIPDHLTCLLRNLYVGQEATIRTLHGVSDWFQFVKEYNKAVYCHPAYNMQSTSWKCQAGRITSWNQDCQEKYQELQICTWYHIDGESEEELKSLLMRVKEES